jgi:hypothetical protein
LVQAIQQFKQGIRSPQGSKPGEDWLGNGAHRYVIVGDDGEPYPVKEIIRLAVRIATGSLPPRFSGGIAQANRYVERYQMTVVPKAEWRQMSR